MPDPVIHYAVSVLISSRLYRLRTSMLIALAGVLPDVDVIFGVHRGYTHTLIIPICLALVASALRAYGHKEASKLLYTVSLLYLTHLLLDMFTGLGPFFWPVSNLGLFINVTLPVTWTVLRGVSMVPQVDIVLAPYTPHYSEIFKGTLCTNMSIIVLISVLIALILERTRRRRD